MKNSQETEKRGTAGITKRRIGRLDTARDVQRYLARCIKMAEKFGDLEKYNQLSLMASRLLKAIETASLEDEIKRLQARIKEREGLPPAK